MTTNRKRLWADLALATAAFALLVAGVCLLWRNNPLLFTVMLAGCLLALWRWHDRLELSFFLIIAVLGTLAEAVFVRSGVWQYANPSFLGLPLWFPLAFGTTGLVGARLARTLAALWEHHRPPACQRPKSLV